MLRFCTGPHGLAVVLLLLWMNIALIKLYVSNTTFATRSAQVRHSAPVSCSN
jgi:hypothetical protein